MVCERRHRLRLAPQMTDSDPSDAPDPRELGDQMPPADPTEEFQARLAEVLLTAYGRGAIVETTLEIEGPIADAPNWHVTIEKVRPTDRTYDPALLDDESER